MKQVILNAGRPFANLQWFLRPALLVFSIYWLSRFAFMVKYPFTASGMLAEGIGEFVLLSIRFDLSLFFSVSLLPFLLLVTVGGVQRIRTLAKIIFTLSNGLFLLFNTIDLYFFGFNGRRTDWPALQFLMQDAFRQIPQLSMHYPLVPFTGLLVFWLIWKSFGKQADASKNQKSSIFHKFLSGLLVLAAGIGLIRNSLGQKPLLPGNAFGLQPHQAGHAALNTGFVLLKTLESSHLERAAFIEESEIRSLLTVNSAAEPQVKGRNLVLIILEGFSSEYTGLENDGAGQTPFLDSLAKAGIFFPHHFASGRTSRDALPSILASLPPWMDESFYGSPYVSVKLEGLGTSLRNAGYETAFFHGGKNGSMSFDLTSRLCGFNRYFGMNEYPSGSDYDGNWGIFDQPFLQFSANEISKLRQPFAAGIFTLSSHQPYTLPSGWSDTAGTRGQKVYQAIRYADQALRDFFRSAAAKPWFKNTLFVLTADHTHVIMKPEYQHYSGWFDVPLVFYAPGKKISADTSTWLQHTDIRPRILNLLGIKGRLRNHLASDDLLPLPPMQYQDGNYHVIHPSGLLVWDGKQLASGWRWEAKNNQKEPEGLRRLTMARLQYFRNGLLDDSLFR